ncbi:MAG: hypothetical protein ACI4GA_06365 [Acutalibacteraceae bacterium]
MKIKRIICLLLVLVIGFSLSACGGDKTSPSGEQDSDAAIVNNNSSDGIDVDLTKLSSTMVYSEVYNMMTAPDSYIGKTVRMKGKFSIYQDETTNFNYYACIISDATACCSQGLEFVMAGDYSYPQDYPQLGTEITVTGEFQTYQENGQTYCHLIGASLV